MPVLLTKDGRFLPDLNFLIALGNKENKHERRKEQHHGVKQIADDVEGTNGVAHRTDGGNGNEELCTVR